MKNKVLRTVYCFTYVIVAGYLPWSLTERVVPESWGAAGLLICTILLIVAISTVVLAVIGEKKYDWLLEPMIDPQKFYGDATPQH